MNGIWFILATVWFGFVLDEEFSLSRGDFLVRLAAAIVLGAFWGTWLVFLLSLAWGFGDATLLGGTALLAALSACAWKFRGRDGRWFASLLGVDRGFWKAAAIPTLIITGYFSIAFWMDAKGDLLFRGNSRDLAFHMGTVSAFLEQDVVPPLNPQSASAKLSYHFMANVYPAILCKGGFSLYCAMKVAMVLFAFSLSTLTAYFFHSILKNRAATLFATLLFFFGHIGMINLAFGLLGHPSGNVPLSLTSWASVQDHLTYPYYNFVNVIIDYFQPQLPFLFGFPVAMLILVALHRKCVAADGLNRTSYFLLALAAFLPLVHMHTFLTLSPLVGLLVLLEPETKRPLRLPAGWSLDRVIAKIAGEPPPPEPLPSPPVPAPPTRSSPLKVFALLLATLPVGIQLGFILAQPKMPGFSGFDVSQHLGALTELPDFPGLKRIWFWLRAAGVPLVLGTLGIVFTLRLKGRRREERRGEFALLALLAVTLVFFVVINFYRFTPNWGDCNKFFLYLDLVLCLYAGRWLAFFWNGSAARKAIPCVLLAVGAVLPSTVEWVMRYCREPERLFSASDRLVADWIKINTPGDSVFLTANSFVHYTPALAGRRVINGSYTRETGFADSAIEELVARAYRDADPSLITTAKVTHIVVGPEEEAAYYVNRAGFERRHKVVYDQYSRGLRYSIYEAREQTAEDIQRERDHENGRAFIWLSELPPAFVQQEYGNLKYDKAFSLYPLTLRQTPYTNGLGTHANSEIHFDLKGRYRSFESDIGVDNSQGGGAGSVKFSVWVDNRKAYESQVLTSRDPIEHVSIDVTGASRLRLVAEDGGDGIHGDHADWAGAKLIKNQ
ncbi:MAG TPA: NPCBM/NEW2 domain-containing protein [Rariglobus sp.]